MLIRDSEANINMVVFDDANLLRCYKGTIPYRLQHREVELLRLRVMHLVLGDVRAVQISRLCQQGGSGGVARHLRSGSN